jgi:hypothetical protein
MKPLALLALTLTLLFACEQTEHAPPDGAASVVRNADTESILRQGSTEKDEALSENEKIEALILSLKQIVGAKFIRNGQEYTLDEAIDHMRQKWEWKKSEIKTVEDFIKIAGSKSSMSGKPYTIRMPDGSETKTEEWFRKQLDSMKKLPSQRIDIDIEKE